MRNKYAGGGMPSTKPATFLRLYHNIKKLIVLSRYNDELREEIQKLSADLHKYKQAARIPKLDIACQVCEQDLRGGS